MTNQSNSVPAENIESLIRTIRGQKVILDNDLSRVFGVPAKRLNEQVKRNRERFPADFMFQLNREEAEAILRSRSQIATLNRGQNIKYLPYAFTENGAIMAANVLNSPQAVRMSVFVVRAFVKMRAALVEYAELSQRIDELEALYDYRFRQVFDAIRDLITLPTEPRRDIKSDGFFRRTIPTIGAAVASSVAGVDNDGGKGAAGIL